MVLVVVSVIIIILFINLIMYPVQYRYLEAIKEMEKEYKLKGLKQGDMYDSREAGEWAIHSNAQGNIMFLPANLVAAFVYKRRHKNDIQ